jgi:predicted Zn-ribbon and HTH transcriptional regulator
MALVPAKCTTCGANLNVDPTKDTAVCECCKSAFIVEKAINFYHTTHGIWK